MFQDEARYKVDHYIQQKDLNLEQNKIAKIYCDQRAILVDRLFQMGQKFTQRIKTTHIAIELMDRYFLNRSI
jgi:3-phenylpropionate/cinnamic acid dioxygenase small subunit